MSRILITNLISLMAEGFALQLHPFILKSVSMLHIFIEKCSFPLRLQIYECKWFKIFQISKLSIICNVIQCGLHYLVKDFLFFYTVRF